MTTILIVGDEYITSADIRDDLIGMGCNVPVTVDTGKEATERA